MRAPLTRHLRPAARACSAPRSSPRACSRRPTRAPAVLAIAGRARAPVARAAGAPAGRAARPRPLHRGRQAARPARAPPRPAPRPLRLRPHRPRPRGRDRSAAAPTGSRPRRDWPTDGGPRERRPGRVPRSSRGVYSAKCGIPGFSQRRRSGRDHTSRCPRPTCARTRSTIAREQLRRVAAVFEIDDNLVARPPGVQEGGRRLDPGHDGRRLGRGLRRATASRTTSRAGRRRAGSATTRTSRSTR